MLVNAETTARNVRYWWSVDSIIQGSVIHQYKCSITSPSPERRPHRQRLCFSIFAFESRSVQDRSTFGLRSRVDTLIAVDRDIYVEIASCTWRGLKNFQLKQKFLILIAANLFYFQAPKKRHSLMQLPMLASHTQLRPLVVAEIFRYAAVTRDIATRIKLIRIRWV